MIQKIKLIIKGVPSAKQSTRAAILGKKLRLYQPAKVKLKEENIKLQVLNQLPKDFMMFQCEVHILKCHFIFPIPKSFSKKKINQVKEGKVIYKNTKPDLTDNLSKGLIDAMEGIIFVNDSRIVSMNNYKKYYGVIPRIEIELEGE